MIRRLFAYAVFLAVVAVVAGIRFYPQLRRWLPAARSLERSVTPVAAPGSAPVEGPYFSDGGRVADRIVAAINHT